MHNVVAIAWAQIFGHNGQTPASGTRTMRQWTMLLDRKESLSVLQTEEKIEIDRIKENELSPTLT